jgi:hypothetical protein
MVSTTADAQFLNTTDAPAKKVQKKAIPDDSAVGFSAPNGIFLVVTIVSALCAFAVPFLLTQAGPHH